MLCGEFFDLVACFQIKNEGAQMKHPFNDEDAIPDLI
jgi:hypothetical protein